MTHRVFVSGEVSLEVSCTDAQARLATLIGGGVLDSASAQAYCDGITGVAGVGPLGAALGLPRLCQVYCQDLKAGGDSARLALRWEVIGPAGLFPALDADITLTPIGKHSATLTLAGVYRTPLGAVSAGLDGGSGKGSPQRRSGSSFASSPRPSPALPRPKNQHPMPTTRIPQVPLEPGTP